MKTRIIILVGFALAIWIMFQMPVPTLYPKLPEPQQEVLLAITPTEYAELSEDEKLKYGKWEWQNVIFWCPSCGVQYTLKVKPRISYFRYITDYDRPQYFTSKTGGHGCFWPDISFWLIQLTVMQDETGKPLIFKCQKCSKVFRLPYYGFGVPSKIPIAGVSGYNR